MRDSSSTKPQRILAIYAHPDDECYCSGGTLAKYSAEGAETKVISATRGQAGEIHDVQRATRQTLGQARANELKAACRQLGVHHVECWDYMDGGLAEVHPDKLVGQVVAAIRTYKPHVVITFGPDGAYGHPDHVTIGWAATRAFTLAGREGAYPEQLSDGLKTHQAERLYYAHFPERDLLLMEELADWLMKNRETFAGTMNFAHGLSLFAKESTMLNFSRDFVETRWFPPGFCIVEQGETGSDLYIVLSGTVEIQREEEDGTRTHVCDLGEGEFFGEIGVATHHVRTAHVLAKTAVTCLVFSPGERSNYMGRGEGAVQSQDWGESSDQGDTGLATHMIDVRRYVLQKMAAIGEHRTQTPVSEDMLPVPMLEQLFGYEFFVQIYPKRTLENSL